MIKMIGINVVLSQFLSNVSMSSQIIALLYLCFQKLSMLFTFGILQENKKHFKALYLENKTVLK